MQDGGAPISAMSVKISKNKTCTIQMEVQVESREKLDAVLKPELLTRPQPLS